MSNSEIHLLLHRTTAAEAHRRAVAATRRAAFREREGRRPVVWRAQPPGPADLAVTLAA
ncbi:MULTISPECIES: hypothetical protein [unclassified Streptomyces]|uniref:hypothetical protein n=1 Tax=unclassified Streptomyces TaxID=2593676 RepID=UPI00331C0B44